MSGPMTERGRGPSPVLVPAPSPALPSMVRSAGFRLSFQARMGLLCTAKRAPPVDVGSQATLPVASAAKIPLAEVLRSRDSLPLGAPLFGPIMPMAATTREFGAMGGFT